MVFRFATRLRPLRNLGEASLMLCSLQCPRRQAGAFLMMAAAHKKALCFYTEGLMGTEGMDQNSKILVREKVRGSLIA